MKQIEDDPHRAIEEALRSRSRSADKDDSNLNTSVVQVPNLILTAVSQAFNLAEMEFLREEEEHGVSTKLQHGADSTLTAVTRDGSSAEIVIQKINSKAKSKSESPTRRHT